MLMATTRATQNSILTQIIKEQAEDADIEALTTGGKANLIDNIWYFHNKVAAPCSMRTAVMPTFHKSIVAEHLEAERPSQ